MMKEAKTEAFDVVGAAPGLCATGAGSVVTDEFFLFDPPTVAATAAMTTTTATTALEMLNPLRWYH